MRRSRPRHERGRRGKPASTNGNPARGATAGAAILLVPALLAAAVFTNTLGNRFVYDDVWKMGQLQGPPPSFWSLLQQPRGLTHMFHWLDRSLWGDWTPGFHLTNLLLHTLAAALAGLAAFAVTRSRRIALLTGLLFAVHPVHVEAVASFANRKDLLAMIFAASALILWRGERRPLLCYAGSWACYGLGLLSKEVAVAALPGMLFMADLLALPGNSVLWRERLRRALLRSLPIFLTGILAAGWIAGRLPRYFTTEAIHATTEQRLSGYPSVLGNAAAAVLDQARLLAFPWRLAADYSARTEVTLAHPRALLGLALLVAWSVGAALLARRNPAASFGMIWTAVMALPCSNLVPLTPFFVAERYLYVPSFGFCLAAALLLDWQRREAAERPLWVRTAAAVLPILLICLGGARVVARNRDWRDDRALWTSALQAGSDTWRVRLNLGNSFLSQGDRGEALRQFRLALRDRPLPISARETLVGNLILAGGNLAAFEECRDLLVVHPDSWSCHYLSAEVQLSRGKRAPALRHYQRALIGWPNDVEILIKAAWLLATSPEDELRDARQATRLAERALQLDARRSPEVLETLAAAYAEAGDVRKATPRAWEAYDRAMAQRRVLLAAQIRGRIQRFETTGAYRQ
jgi:tetratricopeptide (TPR) repeat protein